MPTEDIIVVGRIGSPYGVQGWMHLQSYTSPVDNILDYRPWFLKAPHDGKHQQWRPVAEMRCRAHKKGFVASISEVADRDAAAAMTGQLIGVPASALPDLGDEGEFYWRELVGCEVVSTSGEELGVVDHLLETGANDVLFIRGDNGETLVPFVDEYIDSVDLEGRKVTVNWDSQW